jgi:hypothetical protein
LVLLFRLRLFRPRLFRPRLFRLRRALASVQTAARRSS